MKKLNPIVKSVIVLSAIVFTCAGLLVAANKLLYVSDEVRLGRTLDKLMSNSGATVVYDIDDQAKSKEIIDFNAVAPARERIDGSVLRVYKVKDDTGVNEGKYVIEAKGAGFNSDSVSLIAFNKNGTVYGVSVKKFGAVEDRSNYFKVSDLSDKIKAASAANEAAGNSATKITSSIMPATQATRTIDGILNATNIASVFYKEVIIGVGPVVREPVELVDNATIIGRLDELMRLGGEEPSSAYYELPYIKKASATIPNIGSGNPQNRAEIVTTYISADSQIILHVEGRGYSADGGANGGWSVLLLMDETDRIQAVYMLSNTSTPEDSGDVDYSPLEPDLNSAYLTAQLKDKDASYFSSASNHIFMAQATETNNGIKVVAYLAVTECADIRSQVETVLGEHGLPAPSPEAFSANTAEEESL